MYTELIKIIEGGLNGDPKKVASYAKHLAEKYKQEGDIKYHDRIMSTLNKVNRLPIYKDQLFETPVDQETRLDIATVSLPHQINTEILIPESIDNSVKDFIELANARNKIQQLGLDVNLSLLLYGPPGCGKTSIAKYIAKELDLPIVVARFDSLISSLLGSTAKNIRKLFDYAKNKPCILFLDEFDAIAKARDDQHEMGELKRVINSLLQNIDDFLEHNFLIAATNHENLLDRAVWRRFEKVIKVDKPEPKEIKSLIQYLLNKTGAEFLSDDKRLDILSAHFKGYSHSEIKKVINSSHYNSIIKGYEELQYEAIVLELLRYSRNNSFSQDDSISFLAENGVTQKGISDFLNVSMRQVRNILTHESNGSR
jgi:SpoVK/Ycf46/Vps4 family AAA+-type ATPase